MGRGKKRQKSKSPKHAAEPRAEKKASHREVSFEDQKPSICFTKFDPHDWRKQGDTDAYGEFLEVAKLVHEYQKKTWRTIRTENPTNQHSIDVDRIVRPAQKRLRDLELDDFDELWRFRFSNKWRLWGVKTGSHFTVIWWDPHHMVCPSKQKRT